MNNLQSLKQTDTTEKPSTRQNGENLFISLPGEDRGREIEKEWKKREEEENVCRLS